jgi:hypothetical protein
VDRLKRMLMIAVAMSVGSACGAGTSRGGSSSPTHAESPLASASPTREPATTPASDVLIKCEDFPQQTYTNSTFGFSIACPSSFSWEIYSNPYEAQFLASASQDTPQGSISISVYRNDVGTVRDWIPAHTGAPNSGEPRHFWGSTSHVSDTQVAGRPAVGFDTTSQGPGPPPTGRAVALVLPDGNVFVIYWSAYKSDYAATLGSVAQQMIATIQV